MITTAFFTTISQHLTARSIAVPEVARNTVRKLQKVPDEEKRSKKAAFIGYHEDAGYLGSPFGPNVYRR